MSEQRIYPRDSPPVSGEHKPFVETPPVSGEYHPDGKPMGGHYHHRPTMSQDSFTSSKMSYAAGGYGGGPHPGTYVIQVPKDQVYRVPPPENAHKYKLYTQRKSRQNRCRCCMCTILAILLTLIVLLGIAIAVIFLVYNPKAPSYSVEKIQVKGVNLNVSPSLAATAATVSPVFNVTVKTENRNGKIGIYYEQGSSVKIYHNGVNFCDGSLPAFYQPPNSATVFSRELSGAGIVLAQAARERLLTEQKNGKVPLVMDVEVPVKIKIGAVKTWTITVKVSCDITISALTDKAKVVSKSCGTHVKPW